MGRRVLVTGLSTFWGGRVAKTLEADPDCDVIVGLDTQPPTIELDRTEYVRVDENYSILARIVREARIDTIVHTFLVVNSDQMPARRMHEINVIGTMNLFAAASTPASTVRTVLVKSSTLVYGAAPEDPVWFAEDTRRSHGPRTRVERTLLEVEEYVRGFAEDNPHVSVSLLRFANVLGPDIRTPMSAALDLPVVPSLFGFDPRLQFVHEDDVVRSIIHVLDNDVSGIYNVAGDGLLPWSEVAAICGKRTVPLFPYGLGLMRTPMRALGFQLPPEMIDMLKFGRGVDNRKLQATGFQYDYTSAGAVHSFAQAMRLRRTVGDHEPTFRFEADVENFFRHSPAVVREE